MDRKPQNYANHAKIDPLFHRVLLPGLLALLILAVTNVVRHYETLEGWILVLMTILLILLAFKARIYALKAQDRAIRAEEHLRHFVLTGKLLDPRLTIRQTVALRFAPDGEFVPLAERGANENLTPDAIKRAIKEWRPDTYRV